MSKKIFYVISLDKNRILLLISFFLTVIFFSLTLGVRIGKTGSEDKLANTQSIPKEIALDMELEDEVSLSKENITTLTPKIKENTGSWNENEKYKTITKKATSPKKITKKPLKNKKVKPPRKPIASSNSSISKKVPESSSIEKSNLKNVLSSSQNKTQNSNIQLSNIKPNNKPKEQKWDYKLQVGAFSALESARSVRQQLERLGFITKIVKKEDLYVVRVGSTPSNIDKTEQNLRVMSYEAIRAKN